MKPRDGRLFVALTLLIGTACLAEDGPLTLADIAGLHAALQPGAATDPPRTASFRDLWDHPESFLGKRVRVEGEVRRLFHQGAAGQLPALVEVWLTTGSGDPICLLSPEASPKIGSRVSFVGVYLKKIEYRATDVPRLAPLIVGPGVPEVIAPSKVDVRPPPRPISLDWAVGGGAALVLILALMRNYQRRPPPPRIDRDPPPVFIDGDEFPADDRTSPHGDDVDGDAISRS
ncbi:hypothetical protein EP7_004590 [Isosphaeraceae bacterium EP7]